MTDEVYTITLRQGVSGYGSVQTTNTNGTDTTFWVQNPNASYKRYKMKLANFYVNTSVSTDNIPQFLEFNVIGLSSMFNFDTAFQASSLGTLIYFGTDNSYVSRPSFNIHRILNYPQNNILEIQIQNAGSLYDGCNLSGWVGVLEMIPYD